jgi:hypothetical protein
MLVPPKVLERTARSRLDAVGRLQLGFSLLERRTHSKYFERLRAHGRMADGIGGAGVAREVLDRLASCPLTGSAS